MKDESLLLECINRIEVMKLPLSNIVRNVLPFTKNFILVDYLNFCAYVDKVTGELGVVDNYDGEYETSFVYKGCNCILTSENIIMFQKNKILKYEVDFDEYQIFKGVIIFHKNNSRILEIFKMDTFEVVQEICTYDWEYFVNVYEDPQLEKCFIIVSFRQHTEVNFQIYDIKIEHLVEYSFKSFQNMLSVLVLNSNTILYRMESYTGLLDLNCKTNSFQLCLADKEIEEISFLHGINKTFVKSSSMFFIIEEKEIGNIKTKSLNKIQTLIDTEIISNSMYFSYDTCQPHFNEKQDVVIYMYNNSLFISKTTDNRILLMKPLEQSYSYSSISYSDTDLCVYLGTSNGDIIILSV